MKVSQSSDVSHTAGQSIKRFLVRQTLWALLCLALLTSSLEKESQSQTLLVSFCTQPLDRTRHGALPHSTSHWRQSEAGTNDPSLLRTPPWPCRTPHSTGFEYRQQDGTIDRLNRHGCYDFGLSSTCQVHRKAAARQHHHSGESSWLLYYDKSGQLSNTVFTREITRKSTLTRIRIAFRPHYISDSSRIWGSLTFMKRWPVVFQTFGLHFKYYQSIISHCRSQTPHKECQKNSNTVDLKQYWRPSPPPPTY